MSTRSLETVAIEDSRARELKAAAKNADKWRARRDEKILQARAEGATLREIAALVGLSHAGVLKILGRHDSHTDIQWAVPGSALEEVVVDMIDGPES